MKILTVNNTADRYGASRCLERVFGSLVEQGHEIHAVLPEDGPLVSLLEARGVHVHVHTGLSILDRNQLRTAAGALSFAAGLPLSAAFLVRLILRLGIDVVHTNTVVLPSPSLAALLTRRPHVWHVRELLQDFGLLWRPYQRWISVSSSVIVAISRCVRDQFSPKLRPSVPVVYDGLDPTSDRPDPENVRALRARFPAGSLLVGVVGRIKWHRKGQEVLVEAASLLHAQHPEAHYIIAGTPSPGNEGHETRLRDLIRSRGLHQVVHLIGEVEDTASLFAALDMAVAPSVQPEPFGCVVLEAMAARTATIGSQAGGIAEQILPGQTGLLFRPGDAADLARALHLLLRDPSLRERMAESGKHRADTEFQLAQTTREMSVIFSHVSRRGAIPMSSSVRNGQG